MFRLRTIMILAVCLLLLVQSQTMVAQPPAKKGEPLFNGKNFAGWYKFSGDKKVNAEDLISIQRHKAQLSLFLIP